MLTIKCSKQCNPYLCEDLGMTDILHDIDVIENAIIAFTEGASDEKYAAMHSLEKLLIEKKDLMSEFETAMENSQ